MILAQEASWHPNSAVEFIAAALRTDVLFGRLAAGDALPLDQLAKRFGTSQTPVREALRTLQAQGYVVLRPHRTPQVAELDVAEFEHHFSLLLLLQPEAVR